MFDDDSGQPVGGTHQFRNAANATLASGVFCCLENGGTGAATTGTATATFKLQGSTTGGVVYELPRCAVRARDRRGP